MACTKVPPKVSHTPYISFYNYKQLTGNRSIRVAQFQPSSGPTCPLRCDLEVISLDDCAQQNSGRDPKEPKIQYTAISYAWDSQRPSQPIICNGKVLLVTKNCAAALRRLRNDTETRNFWVDSICINQDEDAVEERNQQVALMGEIYSRATDVAVWIGEADYESAVAIIAIPMIYESIPLDPIAPLDTDKPMTESTTAFKKSLKQHMNKMIFESKSLESFFERSWFKRMWTIQEVLMTDLRHVRVYCGEYHLHIMEVFHATVRLAGAAQLDPRLSWTFTHCLRLQRVLQLGRTLQKRLPSTANHVLQILISTRNMLATDPRDKIYALYHVCGKLGIPFPKPDYSKSVEDVFREAAVLSITYDNSLHVLFYARSKQRRDGLASWIPDWSEPSVHERLNPHTREGTGPFQPVWSLSDDNKILLLKGNCIDEIQARSERMPDGEYWREFAVAFKFLAEWRNILAHRQRCLGIALPVFKSWLEFVLLHSTPKTTHTTIKDQFVAAICQGDHEILADVRYPAALEELFDVLRLSDARLANRGLQVISEQAQEDSATPDIFPAEYEITQTLQDEAGFLALADALQLRDEIRDGVLQLLRHPGQGDLLSPIVWGTWEEMPHAEKIACALRENAGRLTMKVAQLCIGMRLFCSRGGFFGLALDIMDIPVQEGDKIAVIAGLDSLTILRPMGDCFRLITQVSMPGLRNSDVYPTSEDELKVIKLI